MKIHFLGDVFLDKKYNVDLELENFIFNLEYPLSKKGIPAKNKINLGSDIPNIKETFGKYPIAVNLANNHIMDYGEEAYISTIKYLQKHKIDYFGAGNKENNFNNPCVIDFNNHTLALLGYSCPSTSAVFGDSNKNGSAILDINQIITDIKACKNKYDMVIVTLHWGDEEIMYPKYTDIIIAHQIIDAGADLIIGHHAHVIQSSEIYKGKYIFYGIGNFIFPDFKVNSYYDGNKFTKESSKIQQKLNKQSIIININEELKVDFDTVVFDNGVVKYGKINLPKWLPQSQLQYDLMYKYIKRMGTIKRFLQNPKMPTLKQIKIFFGMK